MQIHTVNSSTEAIQQIIVLLNQKSSRDYVLFLSGKELLVPYYKTFATSFTFPFPKHVALLDDIWQDGVHDTAMTTESILKRSGIMGRALWEKSDFHPIFSENSRKPQVEAGGYAKEILELSQTLTKNVVSITAMDSDGGFSGIRPFSEAVTSDDLFVAYEDKADGIMRVSATLSCVMASVTTNILIVDSDQKWGLFSRIMERESNIEEFPILAFKNLSDTEVYCYSC